MTPGLGLAAFVLFLAPTLAWLKLDCLSETTPQKDPGLEVKDPREKLVTGANKQKLAANKQLQSSLGTLALPAVVLFSFALSEENRLSKSEAFRSPISSFRCRCFSLPGGEQAGILVLRFFLALFSSSDS